MTSDPKAFRPKAFPPPQFPPHRPALFARMPPAVFPVLLGTLGLGLALRRGFVFLGLPGDVAELLLGLAVGLWVFAAAGYAIKLLRRPGVLIEDLRPLPGRAGLASAGLGMMLVAAALAPYAPGVGRGVLVVAMALHLGLAALVLRGFFAAPAEAREITPVWHLQFTGFIVAALAAVLLGWPGLAQGLLYATLPVGGAIWGWSVVQLVRRIPPAPLRPLLAIHLAPASLFATVSAELALPQLAQGSVALAGVIFLALMIAARWIVAAGFSALWAAFTFPLAAFASALFAVDLGATGTIVLALAAAGIPPILIKVLQAWAKGGLAAKTNAAEA